MFGEGGALTMLYEALLFFYGGRCRMGAVTAEVLLMSEEFPLGLLRSGSSSPELLVQSHSLHPKCDAFSELELMTQLGKVMLECLWLFILADSSPPFQAQRPSQVASSMVYP